VSIYLVGIAMLSSKLPNYLDKKAGLNTARKPMQTLSGIKAIMLFYPVLQRIGLQDGPKK